MQKAGFRRRNERGPVLNLEFQILNQSPLAARPAYLPICRPAYFPQNGASS